MEEKPSPTTDRHLIRVLIAEDHLLARAGIRAVVNTQPDMKIVGAAVNGLQAVSMYRTLRPDVTLMDMWMPVMDGKTFLHHYWKLPIVHAPVIIMTAYDPIQQDKDLIRGVADYLLKPFDLNVMHECIKNNLSKSP